ncbi:hypothetical protein DXG01_011480 [Tephrocybe rancida]|nr:hypothetical protein DXG01_011480 [Tephrocybe rancida]
MADQHSLLDTIVGVSRLGELMEQLDVLREELEGVEGMEEPLKLLMQKSCELEESPESSMKQLDIKMGAFLSSQDGLVNVVDDFPDEINTEIENHTSQLDIIYEYIDLTDRRGMCMLLRTILASMAKVSSMNSVNVSKLPVALSDDPTRFSNPSTRYGVDLYGEVERALLECKTKRPLFFTAIYLSSVPSLSRSEPLQHAGSCILIVGDERLGSDVGFHSLVPWVVGQALDWQRNRIHLKTAGSDVKNFREVNALSRLSHRFIVRYFTTWVEIFDEPISAVVSDDSRTEFRHRAWDDLLPDLSDYYLPTNGGGRTIDFDDLTDRSSLSSKSTFPSIHFDGALSPGTGESSRSDDEASGNLFTLPVTPPPMQPRTLYIQMEFVERQTLKEGITQDEAWQLFQQNVDALAHMSELSILHPDIKLTNNFIG